MQLLKLGQLLKLCLDSASQLCEFVSPVRLKAVAHAIGLLPAVLEEHV